MKYLNHLQKFWQGHFLDFIFYNNLLKLYHIIANQAFALWKFRTHNASWSHLKAVTYLPRPPWWQKNRHFNVIKRPFFNLHYHRLIAALDLILISDVAMKGFGGPKASLRLLGLIDELCQLRGLLIIDNGCVFRMGPEKRPCHWVKYDKLLRKSLDFFQ